MIRATVTNRRLRVPAVGYLRMSSKKQDKSISAQRVEVERYAAANGLKILRWYTDEGISGSESEKREGFQQLMHDADNCGDFEVILCWDQDRFSRFDPLEANHYWYLLRNAGVRIVTVRQGELDLGELGGWLVASINQHGKNQYLKDLSANVLRGRLRKAENGLWAGSRAQYGYALTKDGRLVLGDPEHVATVKWLFETYASRDTSLRELAQTLNDRGVPSPSGRKWIGAAVQLILRREAYLGTATQFRESKGKFHTVKGRGVAPAQGYSLKPKQDWFNVTCPAIVDRELWDRCAAKLVRRRTKTSPVPTKQRGLLTGLAFCGHCGAPMHVYRKVLDSSGDVVLCCSTYNVHGNRGCHRNMIHQGQILPFLLEKIQELVLSPKNLGRLEAAIEKQTIDRQRAPKGEVARLRRQIGKLDADIRAAAAELKRTPKDLYPLVVEDLRQLRARRDRQTAELEQLENYAERPTSDGREKLRRSVEAIHRLQDALRAADPAIVREALGEICERIDLWFDHQSGPKLTRSFFSKGLVQFRKPTDLSVPASWRY